MKKGISLVALVVTIIVLVILAGAVVLTMMDDSIFDKANTAVEEQNRKEVFSAVQREVLNVQLENVGLQVGEEFAQKLQTKLNDKYKEANITTTYDETTGKINIGYKLDEKEYSLGLSSNYQLSIEETVNGEGEGSDLPINDERVSELLNTFFGTWELSESEVVELKKALNINNVESNNVFNILYCLTDEEYNDVIVYFYTIDRVYIINENMEIRYVSKTEDAISYEYAEKLGQILLELKTAFIGKTETEIDVMYKNGTLNSYILENCTSIKTVDTYETYNNYIRIGELTFEFGGLEYDDYNFCGYNTFEFITNGNGTYIDIYLVAGA